MIQYLPFSVWLISLSKMPSKSIHVAASGNVLFFFIFPMVYMYHFCIHSSVHGPWGCFQALVVVNNAAVRIGVCFGGGGVSFRISVFVSLERYPGVEILGYDLFFLFGLMHPLYTSCLQMSFSFHYPCSHTSSNSQIIPSSAMARSLCPRHQNSEFTSLSFISI